GGFDRGLEPLVEVGLLDRAVEVLDLDRAVVRIDRDHFERIAADAPVPLADDRCGVRHDLDPLRACCAAILWVLHYPCSPARRRVQVAESANCQCSTNWSNSSWSCWWSSSRYRCCRCWPASPRAPTTLIGAGCPGRRCDSRRSSAWSSPSA